MSSNPADFGIILESDSQCGYYAVLSVLCYFNLIECQRLQPVELIVCE